MTTDRIFNAPTVVNLEVTELCNAKCRHCYNPWREESMGVNSFDDHRVAMAFLIAGISAKEPITVLNTKNILTSFPDFYSLIKDAGVNIIRENN